MPTPWARRRRAALAYEAADDHALVVASRRDPQAFGVLYDRHATAVLAYFARRTADAEAAADLTAETFAAALDGIARYDPAVASPAAWLYGIAHHQLTHWLRREVVDGRARDRLALVPLALDDVSSTRIDALVDAERERAGLEAALDGLSRPLREAVELRVLGELSYAEVAQRSGCSVGVARVRVSRALERLSWGSVTRPATDDDVLAARESA